MNPAVHARFTTDKLTADCRMPTLSQTLEALLFVSGQPLSEATLAKYAQAEPLEVRQTLEELHVRWKHEDRGIQLLQNGASWQLVSEPSCAPAIVAFAKEEVLGELTKAQLETLAVIAYRGPLSKRELDHIRGVNCRQIMRNLLIRGLVESAGSGVNDDEESFSYQVSAQFMRHLGLTALEELPEYEGYHSASIIDDVVEKEI